MNALTQRHRAQQILLQRGTAAQFARLWTALDYARLDATFPDLALRAAVLVAKRRDDSAGIASAYLRAHRRDNGVRGNVPIQRAAPINAEHLTASLHSTSVAPLKASAARGELVDVAMANALTLAQGAVTRLVLGGGREVIRATTIADSAAQGWVRVGEGGCDWCAQYLDGEVHMVEGYDFDAHDWCKCTAEPVYG